MARQQTTGDVLERLAGEMHSIAFDFHHPAETTVEAERRIEEVERICIEARAVVRGRSR